MAELEHVEDIIGRLEPFSIEDEAGTLKTRKGGKRVGSGRKPTLARRKASLATRTAKEAKEHFVNRVHANVDTLFNAQLSLAKGEQHLFVKWHSGEGKDRRQHIDIVTDPETIRQYLQDNGHTLNMDGDDEYYYISTVPANNQAIDSLLNRAFGKAPEKIEIDTGFFKANDLRIEIVNPEIIDAEEAEVVDGTDTNTETESSAEAVDETTPSS